MSEPIDERLRRGLAGAADALPPHDPQPLRDRPDPHRGRTVVAAAAALLVLGAAGTGVVLARDRGDDAEPGVIAADDNDTETPPETGENTDTETGDEAAATSGPTNQASGNGQAPGQAVATDDGMQLFGADGEPTGTVDLSPLDGPVQSAASDLDGGWVACGMDAERRDRWIWFPADGDPVDLAEAGEPLPAPEDLAAEVEDLDGEDMEEMEAWAESGDDELPDSRVTELEGAGGPDDTIAPNDEAAGGDADGAPDGDTAGQRPMCAADSVQVIDTADGPALIGAAPGEDGFGSTTDLRITVLATGHTYDLPLPEGHPDAFLMGSAFAPDRVAWALDGRIHLADLDSGEQLPVADIPADVNVELSLAPDASSVAVTDMAPEGQPVDVTVYDLETGEELFRDTFDVHMEGFEFSYDGELLAVGNFYESYGPVEVVNVSSGERHTIDAHGVLP